MPTAAIVSFRFAPYDGVSVEARKWAWALGELGFDVRWVADNVVPGLAIDANAGIDDDEVRFAFDGCDLVVVENLLTLPLNPHALDVVARVLRGRPAVVHHHDLPWQRGRFVDAPPPPDDLAWVHVTINELSRVELAARAGIDAVRMYNRFAPFPPSAYEVDAALPRPVALHPTRAIPRKNVPAAVALAEALEGTYWLLGPPEDGYGPELDRVLARARCPVLRDVANVDAADAYSACDVVALPSTWEGFGNATIESALARRPLAIGPYPVAEELRSFGFEWFDAGDADGVRAFLDAPDERLLARNEAIALEHFALADLPGELSRVLERVL